MLAKTFLNGSIFHRIFRIPYPWSGAIFHVFNVRVRAKTNYAVAAVAFNGYPTSHKPCSSSVQRTDLYRSKHRQENPYFMTNARAPPRKRKPPRPRRNFTLSMIP